MDAFQDFLTRTIGDWGYLAIFVAMVLESACIPIPSEITMPFGGLMAASGDLNLWLVGLVGAVANLVGSWIAYAAGPTTSTGPRTGSSATATARSSGPGSFRSSGPSSPCRQGWREWNSSGSP